MAKRCAICGASLDMETGHCTRCKWRDPDSMRQPEGKRCPLCGGTVAWGKCTRCEWRAEIDGSEEGGR